MLFNSLHFLFYFLLTTLLFFSLRGTARVVMLLLVSCYFYAAYIPAYLLILFLVIGIDYVAGLFIDSATGLRRKAWLVGSLVTNVALLAFFKYYDFANLNATYLLAQLGYANPIPPMSLLAPGLVLPIGLSFHTFQSMSYTIEVYRGKYPAERSLLHYSLYVLFYPQLVAGPIERPQNILPQLHAIPAYDWARVRSGLLLMLGGLFKKVVIADRLALLVDPAFGHVDTQGGTLLLVAAVAYSFQIYCDFSGYSDMAIGAGRVMGIEMMTNFRTPYLAHSVTDFWRRWHISLSTWFRDYVYIPLGGNRRSVPRTYLNILCIFGLSGLWHGADWKFVIWGLFHGLLLIAEAAWNRWSYGRTPAIQTVKPTPTAYALRGAPLPFLGSLYMFTAVTIAWVFFRAESLGVAQQLLTKVVAEAGRVPLAAPLSMTELLLSAGLVALLFAEGSWTRWVSRASAVGFWVVFPLGCLLCYFLGVFTNNQFIYFQF